MILTSGNIDGHDLDGQVLAQTHGQAVVHDEQAGLGEPDGDALHLLHDEHHFGAVDGQPSLPIHQVCVYCGKPHP